MVNFWYNKGVIVTGGHGFLGGHLIQALANMGAIVFAPRRKRYDLRHRQEVEAMLLKFGKVDILINLAANVGGIGYNQNHPYDLFYDNAMINLNVIHAAMQHKVGKFVQIGTVCSYSKWAKPPFLEKSLWDGYPEETNAPYGLAKKMALVQLQAARKENDFNGIYLVPTNLYGPGDEFAPYKSHVIPALIRKFMLATTNNYSVVNIWGTGVATRDFLYVTDASEAILLAAERYDRPEPLNIGSGDEIRIATLARYLQELTGFKGAIQWDTSAPDGQPRRALDTRNIKDAIGWEARTHLKAGLKTTINWYKENAEDLIYA